MSVFMRDVKLQFPFLLAFLSDFGRRVTLAL